MVRGVSCSAQPVSNRFFDERGTVMRILVLGSGGREHAIVHSLAASPLADAIFAAPGNGGTCSERATTNVALDPADAAAVVAFARENAIDLAVIGPEGPLCSGLADELRVAGIPTVGPGAEGAQLEGSKSFAKRLMDSAQIPTASSRTFTDRASAEAYLETVSCAARRQGRWPRGRQGRDHRRDHHAGTRRGRRVLRRPVRRSRRRGGHRGVPRGTRGLAPGVRRRLHRVADGSGAGPQACGRRGHGAEHRRHGRVLAGARNHRAPVRAHA